MRSGPAIASDAVMDACKATLARYEVPKHIEFLPELPVTPTGKVLKQQLRQQFSGLFESA